MADNKYIAGTNMTPGEFVQLYDKKIISTKTLQEAIGLVVEEILLCKHCGGVLDVNSENCCPEYLEICKDDA